MPMDVVRTGRGVARRRVTLAAEAGEARRFLAAAERIRRRNGGQQHLGRALDSGTPFRWRDR
jgi:hypothetical protein